jgi:hypothetical protein
VAYRLMERGAVPACDFADRTWAVRKLDRPATTPVCQELAARGADRLSATMKRETGLSRGLKPRRVPRRSAERRARPQADARGNADRPWRAPHWLAGSDALIRSAGADTTFAPLGAPPPYFIWGSFRAVAWHSSDANKKRAARMRMLIHLSPRAGRGRRAERGG